MLEVASLRAGYGPIEVLRGIDLRVAAGEIVALLGSNGAGKSTLNNNISGLYRPFGGTIRFDGKDIAGALSMQIVEAGLVQVPEGRRVFPNLTVRDNLELGSYRRGKPARAQNLERVLTAFPRLRERLRQVAGTLSGGEQQMLAIGRAMLAQPKLLMLDEPSMGLAPLMVEKIFEIIQLIARRGTTILLIEQNAQLALENAHRGYVLESGEITLTGDAKTLLADPRVKEAYLGG